MAHNAGQWRPQETAPFDLRGLGAGGPQPGQQVGLAYSQQALQAAAGRMATVRPNNQALVITKVGRYGHTLVQKDMAHQPPTVLQSPGLVPASSVQGTRQVGKDGRQGLVTTGPTSIPWIAVAVGGLYALWGGK